MLGGDVPWWVILVLALVRCIDGLEECQVQVLLLVFVVVGLLVLEIHLALIVVRQIKFSCVEYTNRYCEDKIPVEGDNVEARIVVNGSAKLIYERFSRTS